MHFHIGLCLVSFGVQEFALPLFLKGLELLIWVTSADGRRGNSIENLFERRL
jgi:hypothetical protein